jgi:hypothetical protein
MLVIVTLFHHDDYNKLDTHTYPVDELGSSHADPDSPATGGGHLLATSGDGVRR